MVFTIGPCRREEQPTAEVSILERHFSVACRCLATPIWSQGCRDASRDWTCGFLERVNWSYLWEDQMRIGACSCGPPLWIHGVESDWETSCSQVRMANRKQHLRSVLPEGLYKPSGWRPLVEVWWWIRGQDRRAEREVGELFEGVVEGPFASKLDKRPHTVGRNRGFVQGSSQDLHPKCSRISPTRKSVWDVGVILIDIQASRELSLTWWFPFIISW